MQAQGDWSGEPLKSGISLWRNSIVLSSSAGTRRLVRCAFDKWSITREGLYGVVIKCRHKEAD
jgi:hypothetical protein